mmetsp:Transcript_6360/g.15792  ORF Transcript_6360/g.15792 Transcript_6360/m.15792 type:complete len:561 (-) Transcript_6360:215-1897(-)
MGTGRWVLYAAAATTGILSLRVGYRVLKIFLICEQEYHWLGSIIPPNDYQYLADVSPVEVVKQRYPQLTEAVESGTLNVLTRPADFDRALPDELYILGTAHVSRRTAQNVYDTIVATEPDAVVVELCRSRSFMMYRNVPDEQDGQAAGKPGASQAAAPTTSTPTPTTSTCTATPAPGAASLPAAGASSSKSSGAAPGRAVSSAATSQGAGASAASPASPAAPAAAGKGAKPGKASGPSMSELLAAGLKALREGQSILQVLLGVAYMQFEGQLKTVAGLEFIRARQAVEVVEARRQRAQLAASASAAKASSSAAAGARTPSPASSPASSPAKITASPGAAVGALPTSSPAAASAAGAGGSGQAAAGAGEQAGGITVAGEDVPEDEVDDSAAARAQAAERLGVGRHTHIYWGDVPLARTISRAWGVLSMRNKMRLVWELLWDIVSLEVDEAMLEELLQEDVFQLLQRELGARYPEIMGPLLHERNWQLAYTVHQAAQHGMRKVVLVVGKCHVPGVVYCLLHPYRMRKANRAWHAARTLSQQQLEQPEQQQQQQQQQGQPAAA